MKRLIFFLILFCFIVAPALAQTSSLKGLVVRIADGDTFTLLTSDHAQYRIRLAEIDAPEKNQPFGMKSKQMLSALVYQKPVVISVVDIDQYGRTVGRVFQDTKDVNLLMVAQGGAWAYRHYLKDQSILAAETQARTNKAGLWALQADQIMPPWDWRHQKRDRRYRENNP